MRKEIALFGVAMLAAGGPAGAGDMSYSYLQFDLQGAELRGGYGILSGAGFAGHGSIAIGPHLYAFSSYGNTRYVGNGLKARFIPATAGVGGHVSLSSEIDLFGGAAAEYLQIRTGVVGFPVEGTRDSFKGWSVTLGGRGWLGENFQWIFDVKHRDLKDLAKINAISLGGRYYIRRAWAVGMHYTYQKYDNFILFGRDSLGSVHVRYTFGNF